MGECEGQTINVRRAAPSSKQRVAVLAGVLTLHAALLLVLINRVPSPSPAINRSILSVVSLSSDRPAAAPPPPSLPSAVADQFKPLREFSMSDAVDSDAPAGTAGACSTLGAVLDGLLVDPEAVEAIRRSPPEARSIAQALVMWNEQWTAAALDPEGPLRPVRANIERTLTAIDDACLDEIVVGPRLLPIPDRSNLGTILIALGSGSWTWRSVVTPPFTTPDAGSPPTSSIAPGQRGFSATLGN